MVNGEEAIAVCRNNGCALFSEGESLDDILLDDPDFWYFDGIDCREVIFTDDGEEWDGYLDWEAVEKAFLNPGGAWATLEGIYFIRRNKDDQER